MNSGGILNVCFVCLGNICRSPLAEGVFQDLVLRKGLADKINIDSAGTSSWHQGEAADERMSRTAEQRGIQLTSRARQFTGGDFNRFDIVLAMDHTNMERLRNLRPEKEIKDKLFLFRSFDPQNKGNLEVPDPYYGGEQGFNHVFEIVERTCPKLLEHIRSKFSIPR